MDNKEELYIPHNAELASGPEDSNCTGSCCGCSGGCDNMQHPRQAKKAYAVVSGKGGTGKTLVTSLLALALRRRGLNVGILDADIQGASIPHLLSAKGNIVSENELMLPLSLEDGIQLMSMSLIAENPEAPLVWSSADTANIASFLWTGVMWGDPDCILIDMPSGIGDLPLNFFATLPLDGVIAVTTPGELAAVSVGNMLHLCNMFMLSPIGFVENMAGLFGNNAADHYHLPDDCTIVSLPFDPKLADLANGGRLREANCPELETLVNHIVNSVRT